MPKQPSFTIGGTVQASGGLYVRRPADEELLELCRNGTFAYILTSRQMGKSSLMVETAGRLQREGIRTAIVDLSQIGVNVNPSEWYFAVLYIICGDLDLKIDLRAWWQKHEHLPSAQRLVIFAQEVLLDVVSDRVVVFIDEIDTTLSLSFTDDFFAALRSLHNRRATVPQLGRLTFVLIGAATPDDLIQDRTRTPFNIGRRVEVSDFTLTEAEYLGPGLMVVSPEVSTLLAWIFKWTSGHPYLTVRLCRAMAELGRESWSEAAVDEITRSTFLGDMSRKDSNLDFIRKQLTNPAPHLSGLLSMYSEIVHKGEIRDEEHCLLRSQLKLSGIVRQEGGRLSVRNRIYATVFDEQWVQDQLQAMRDAYSSRDEDPRVEVANVLFMDVVGSSLLPIDSQRETLMLLQNIVRSSTEFQRGLRSNGLISLPTGDGLGLVFFENPIASLQCALELAQAIKNQPRLKVRMGIHTGPVYRAADVNAHFNVAGSAINVAQRLMNLGDAGHILVSASSAAIAAPISNWAEYLHDLGEFTVKHGGTIHVFNFYTEQLGNPVAPGHGRAVRFKKLNDVLLALGRLVRAVWTRF